MHIIIHGLDIDITTHNIHIEYSYLIQTKSEMRLILNDLKNQLYIASITMSTPFNNRSIKSMVNEWVSHNNLYQLGYKVEQTGSVDLNYPQPWYVKLAYWFLSRIVL